MCGIAGVVCANAAAVETAVRAMMQAMVHRGPDDEGYERVALAGGAAGEPATGGLGFRRLAIMDLSPLGHQPMVDPASGDAIIFNGEIYNAPDLRRRLAAQGATFRSSGDTEVLLRALTLWGERALDELDGMFAFAFYHAASRRLLLARDPLGIKPLYVARVPGAVVFASEVRAVLASGLVPDDLDAAGIAGMLAYGAPQDPLTVHRHVRSMPAGTCTGLDGTAAAGAPERLRRYWSFPGTAPAPSQAAAVDRVRRDLTESVRRQCVADVPLGVFLSGGIDSATMAALATATQGRVDTFAVGYEVAGVADETAAAAETAHFLGTRHFQTIVDDDWAIMQWYEWLKVVDRPSIDGLNTYIVSGAVKDRGITVALSGLGGDELFGGYPSCWRVPRARAALAGLAWLPAGMRRAVASRVFGRLPAEKRAKAVDLLSSRGSAVALTALSRRVLSDEALAGLGFRADRLGLTPEFLPPEAFDAFPTARTGTFERVGQAELSLYMGNTLLRDTDVNSMAHSLEIRVPFLGQELVDYVAGLPGRTRAPRKSQPKHLLRKAISDRLPPSVFTRPKAGFSLPFGEWMRGPLREQCESAIDTLAGWGGIDAARVRRAWDDHVAKRQSAHGSRTLALVVLGNYLAQAKARRPARPSLPSHSGSA
ncbi:MAG: asparagine synthase (glutamine-hydrolyzing) [Planctomycetaceae bacterium]